MATGNPKTKWNGNGAADIAQTFKPGGLEVELAYKGKLSLSEIMAAPPANPVAIWKPEQTLGSRNRLYYGDNLGILSALLKDPTVKGNVRLIYIDPPFSTRSVFHSRAQAGAYCDLLAGAHYIEFLRQRLVLLRELLSEDGSIYVHLDENMAFYIKVVLDEVFGPANFRNWITRKKCNPKNYTRKTYGNTSDYILFYTKNGEYVWNRPLDEWTDERALKEYQYVETGTGRKYKKVPVHAPGERNGETGKPWRGKLPPPGKHWQFPPHKLDELDARGEIYWSANGNPRRKVYFDTSAGIPIQDIWLGFRDAHNQNIKITGYPTEKNPDLMRLIIEASSNPGDVVLDCFSGSGTTLEVSSVLKRHWIGIDNSPEAIMTTLRRFARGSQPMGDFVTKHNGSRPSELPLFKERILSRPRISDFALYADKTLGDDIASVIDQWESWL